MQWYSCFIYGILEPLKCARCSHVTVTTHMLIRASHVTGRFKVLFHLDPPVQTSHLAINPQKLFPTFIFTLKSTLVRLNGLVYLPSGEVR